MTAKPIVLRDQVRSDIDAAANACAEQAGHSAALGLIDALQRACRSIAANPAAGSARGGQELALPGLRSLKLKGHPYLIYYVERHDHADIWRMLHIELDMPARTDDP